MARKKEITLEDAIDLLKKTYARAVQLPFIHNPVAWALYQTWREISEGRL